MLCERNQSQKTEYSMILFIEMFRKKKISRDKGVFSGDIRVIEMF